MGQNQASAKEDNYEVVSKADLRIYENGSLCRDKGLDKLVVLKDRYCEDKEVKEKFEKYLDQGLWKSGYFTTISAQVVGSEGQYCGTCASNHKLSLKFEHFERDLAQEIKRRAEKQEYYDESEVWYMIEAIIDIETLIFKHFKTFTLTLKPENVFLNPEGLIKILDFFLLDSHFSSYRKHALGVDLIPFSPEVLLELKNNQGYSESDAEKVEVWLLGILVLNMISLTPYTNFYKFKEKTVDSKQIEKTLYEIGGKYTPLLRDLIEHCLEDNPRKRCSMATIQKFIHIRKN